VSYTGDVLRASLAAVLIAGCVGGPRPRLERGQEATLVVRGGDSRPLAISDQEIAEGMRRLVEGLRSAQPLHLDVSEPELREALDGLLRAIQARRHAPLGHAERLAAEWLDLHTAEPATELFVLPAGLSYAGDASDLLTSRYRSWCDHRGEPPDCAELLIAERGWDGRQRERLAIAVAMTHIYRGAEAHVRETLDPTRVRAAVAAMIVWYLGMLVIPEPISKVIAVSLTVAMISYVGVDTFLGIVEGYRRLKKEVAATWSFETIAQAGERFGLLVGGTVGRVFILLTTWAMARTVSGVAKIPDPPKFPAAAAVAAGRHGLNLQAAVAGGARTVMVTGPTLTITLAPGAMAMEGINRQKQAGHIKGTPQHANRVKHGKPTSTFLNPAEAEQLTLEAWAKGRPVGGQENLRIHEFGRPVGVGPAGSGYQTQVRVSMDASGQIHGTPYGPVHYGPLPP
jgi:hypothetical protein